MSLGDTTENDVMNYIFKTTAPGWAANANFWVALYTADPGETGTAITNETTYTSYARVSISRTTGFTVSGNNAVNAALVQFPTSTGGATPITYWAIVTTASGAGQIIDRGALSASVIPSTGVQPQFAASALSISVD